MITGLLVWQFGLFEPGPSSSVSVSRGTDPSHSLVHKVTAERGHGAPLAGFLFLTRLGMNSVQEWRG